MRWQKNNLPQSRFSFIVARKEIKRATRRNLLKRRAREIIKEQQGELQEGYDVLFIFSSHALDLSFQELRGYIHNTLQQIKIAR